MKTFTNITTSKSGKLTSRLSALAVRYQSMVGLTLTVLFSLISSNSWAQDVTYSDPLSEVYPNVVTVDDPTFGLGYLMASTSISSGMPSPELTRIDAAGGVLWKNTYSITGASNFRLTDVEFVDYGGTPHFLLTGSSVSSGTQNDLFLMLVDINGGLAAIQQFNIGNYTHSVGLNCIQSTNGAFVVVGMSYNGSSTASTIYDDREAIIMIVDQGLTTFETMSLSTPSISTMFGPVDYDMAETVIETETPERFFLTGKVNGKQFSPAWGAAMSAVVIGDPYTPITLVWENHIELSQDATGADAVWHNYNAEVWLLSNNSATHMPNLTIINEVTGAVVNQVDFLSPTSSSIYDLNYYGFDLHLDLTRGSTIMANIVGWHINYSNGKLEPFVLQTGYTSGVFAGSPLYYYNFSNASYHLFAEDGYLAPFYQKQMPYFTPTLSDIRHSSTGIGGYSILGIEGNTSPFTRKLIGVDMGGIAGNPPTTCTLPQGVPFNPVANPIPTISISTFTTSIGSAASNALTTPSATSATLTHTPCNQLNFAPYEGDGVGLEDKSEHLDYYVSPNPAHDQLTITGLSNLQATLRLVDVSGKVMMEYSGKIAENHLMDVSSLDKGVYFLQVQQSGELHSMKVLKD